jgi:hypothetical protein
MDNTDGIHETTQRRAKSVGEKTQGTGTLVFDKEGAI